MKEKDKVKESCWSWQAEGEPTPQTNPNHGVRGGKATPPKGLGGVILFDCI